MKQLWRIASILLPFLLYGCIGTDFIDDPVINEKLTILPRIDSLTIGQEQVFSVKYSNQYGEEEPVDQITWSSSAPEKIAIDASGKAKALTPGEATIYATNGVLVDSLVLNRLDGNTNQSDTSFFRQGVFVNVNDHYFAKGKVYVETVNGATQIRTAPDFGTSAGPSVYLLLTNHINGSYTVTSGGHAINAVSAQITANKLVTFTGVQVWEVPSGVDPADYKYVVLYCVLGPVFGAAELQ